MTDPTLTAQLPAVPTEYMSDRVLMETVLTELRSLRFEIDNLKAEAVELTSPENLMKLATSFMGGGL